MAQKESLFASLRRSLFPGPPVRAPTPPAQTPATPPAAAPAPPRSAALLLVPAAKGVSPMSPAKAAKGVWFQCSSKEIISLVAGDASLLKLGTAILEPLEI